MKRMARTVERSFTRSVRVSAMLFGRVQCVQRIPQMQIPEQPIPAASIVLLSLVHPAPAPPLISSLVTRLPLVAAISKFSPD